VIIEEKITSKIYILSASLYAKSGLCLALWVEAYVCYSRIYMWKGVYEHRMSHNSITEQTDKKRSVKNFIPTNSEFCTEKPECIKGQLSDSIEIYIWGQFFLTYFPLSENHL